MIVSCPTCGTRYTLEAKSVGAAGRKVRCAKCGHTWLQRPAEERAAITMMAATQDFDSETEIADGPGWREDERRRRFPVLPVALALVVVLLLAGGILARTTIVAAWPPSALLYSSIGLPVEPPGAGLLIRAKSEQRRENGATLLIVEGQIANPTDRERPVPRLEITALGPGQAPLKSWRVDSSHSALLPGEIAIFQSAEPGVDTALEVRVRFEGGAPDTEGGKHPDEAHPPVKAAH